MMDIFKATADRGKVSGTVSKSDLRERPEKLRDTGCGNRTWRSLSVALPVIVVLFLFFGTTERAAAAQEKWAGSRTSPVHRIPLKDEFGQAIIPTSSNPLPFASRFTCIPCHVYRTIKTGRHFNAMTENVPPGRPGEPWVWLDDRTGTQIPLSYRPWPGVFNPKKMGLSPWEFTLMFGRHLPGGGPAEPAEADITPDSRWNVSGKADIDCLGCHSAAKVQDHSEWTKQILRQNFRWAATAASGLGEVKGIASRIAPTWDLFDGPDPDDSEWAVAPSVKYNKALFDSNHRAFLDIAYPPKDERCLACHSTAPSTMKKSSFDGDVHSTAGIACASCHRNDISHDLIRGYAGEAKDNPALLSEEFTCEACHLGGRTEKKEKINPGRMGAPFPFHKGIPKVHFERLACTVCHSGPLPSSEPQRVRTARANRLGIFGAADWSTDLPAVVEPVYQPDTNKKITPHRMMWPAYWGVLENETVRPLRPEEVQTVAGDLLFPERTVTRILAALMNTPGLPGTPVLVLDGKVYETNLDGGLTAKPYTDDQSNKGSFWATAKAGKVTPLIPAFDPTNADEAAEPETLILNLLEALRSAEAAPGKPLLIYKGFLFKVVEGVLEKTARKETSTPEPEWHWWKGEALLPFLPEFEKSAVIALTGTDKTLIESQISKILKILARTGSGIPVYISGGKLFRLNEKGLLAAENHSAAEPIAWPMAHQVRPARQALGINGCTDCHQVASDFFFAKIKGQGPLLTDKVMNRSGTSFMGLTKPYQRLFGLSFAGRPYFKFVLGIAAFILGAVLLTALVLAVGRLSGLIEKRR